MSCPIIDDCLMEGIQEAVLSLMIDTFKVQSFSLVSDGSGGQTQTWTDESTGIAGYMEGSKEWSRELLVGEHQQEVRRWTITLQKDTVIDGSKLLVQTHKDGVALAVERRFKVLSAIFRQTVDFAVVCECTELPNLS